MRAGCLDGSTPAKRSLTWPSLLAATRGLRPARSSNTPSHLPRRIARSRRSDSPLCQSRRSRSWLSLSRTLKLPIQLRTVGQISWVSLSLVNCRKAADRRVFDMQEAKPAAGTESHSIVLFDGVCRLCEKSVNFIIAHDPKKTFRFAPLQ